MRKGRFIWPFLHVKNYTPAEKLAKDVLQVGEDSRYLLVNRECQKDFIEDVKNTLNKRDYFILSQYYGLEDGKKKNLTRIAKEMGVSSNYIGQRRRYSLRKLYQYKCCACLLPEYKKLRKDVRTRWLQQKGSAFGP